jgi:hypothetical protein
MHWPQDLVRPWLSYRAPTLCVHAKNVDNIPLQAGCKSIMCYGRGTYLCNIVPDARHAKMLPIEHAQEILGG